MGMDRRTNTSRVLRSNVKFVNNHFWNCYEAADTGDIVVETVAATDEYLDTYFADHLAQPTKWDRMFQPPQRCRIPTGGLLITCTDMMTGDLANVVFDYPTFNPWWKMRADYRFFYAIGIQSKTSPWFDRIVKFDVHTNTISKQWSSPGIYVSEADFVGAANAKDEEDAGHLVSVLYNETSDMSSALWSPSMRTASAASAANASQTRDVQRREQAACSLQRQAASSSSNPARSAS